MTGHYVNIVCHCYWKERVKEVVVVRVKERVRQNDNEDETGSTVNE